ncbi:protein of unknown function [Maridesulfovibrio hydrothermalis AM13 = DSM 14728]|uniref:Uncharacterized protein n=1 Tax=Maridesulfovibrio hydrothermalis AM13 = DSM 14728 TaxID=1121451 RepID=L0RC75_9BACT|nr:protein of unknown function [Maridesulfovibrio hydrothermalis AM13 = DSM 14728]
MIQYTTLLNLFLPIAAIDIGYRYDTFVSVIVDVKLWSVYLSLKNIVAVAVFFI